MTLLLLSPLPPSTTSRGRNGVIRRIKQRVPAYQKYDKEWWTALLQDILDHWEDDIT